MFRFTSGLLRLPAGRLHWHKNCSSTVLILEWQRSSKCWQSLEIGAWPRIQKRGVRYPPIDDRWNWILKNKRKKCGPDVHGVLRNASSSPIEDLDFASWSGLTRIPIGHSKTRRLCIPLRIILRSAHRSSSSIEMLWPQRRSAPSSHRTNDSPRANDTWDRGYLTHFTHFNINEKSKQENRNFCVRILEMHLK